MCGLQSFFGLCGGEGGFHGGSSRCVPPTVESLSGLSAPGLPDGLDSVCRSRNFAEPAEYNALPEVTGGDLSLEPERSYSTPA
jgi:hypothetical protein